MSIQMTDKECFFAFMFYMARTDGQADKNELYTISTLFPNFLNGKQLDNMPAVKAGMTIALSEPYEQFILDANALLSPPQKICVFLNMLRLLQADGEIADEEKILLNKFRDSWDAETNAEYKANDDMFMAMFFIANPSVLAMFE